MFYDDLNESNVLLYAIKCYDKPNCIQSELAEDYRAFRYIKRLLQKYRVTGKIKERLVLNHLILCQNVFGIEGSTRILFLKLNEKDYSALKTFLVYTSAMPKIVKGIDDRNIVSSDIELDQKLVDMLRKI